MITSWSYITLHVTGGGGCRDINDKSELEENTKAHFVDQPTSTLFHMHVSNNLEGW